MQNATRIDVGIEVIMVVGQPVIALGSMIRRIEVQNMLIFLAHIENGRGILKVSFHFLCRKILNAIHAKREL